MRIRNSVSLLAAGALAAVMVVGAPPAQAGPGPRGGREGPAEPTAAERIVARTLREMGQSARRSCQVIRTDSRTVIARMTRADRQGATDERITSAGEAAKRRNGVKATNAVERIERIRDRGLAALADNGGTDAQVDRINQAAARAADGVNRCKDTANGRIDAAVDRLTD